MPKNIWFFTGGRGSGKSTTACRFARPSEIEQMGVFDTEDSLNDITAENKRLDVSFGFHIRAYDRLKEYILKDKNISKSDMDDWNTELLERISQGKLPWRTEAEKEGLAEYWEWTIATITAHLKHGITSRKPYQFLVIDTIGPLEAGCAAWARKNRKLSGYQSMKFAQGEVEAIRPLLENTMEGFHQAGVQHILITSHTKTPWVQYGNNKARPVYDKVKPGGRLKVWSRISTAMLWMVKPAYPPNAKGAPSAVVMKARQTHTDIDRGADEWDISSPIPPRIPAFSWAEWRKYLTDGYNPLDPKPGETVLPHEREMMSELLSDKEYQLMIAEQQAAVIEDQKTSAFYAGTKETVSIQQTWQEVAAQKISALGNNPTQDQLQSIAGEVNKPWPIFKAEMGV